MARELTVAVEGCAHGNLDEIYDSLLQTQQQNEINIDLLLCCGDFQSIRNEQDMVRKLKKKSLRLERLLPWNITLQECLACPVKYRSMVRSIDLRCECN